MADALDDGWWLESGEIVSVKKTKKRKLESAKGLASVSDQEEASVDHDHKAAITKKKRKRQKKRKQDDIADEAKNPKDPREEFMRLFSKYCKKNLTEYEDEELKLDDDALVDTRLNEGEEMSMCLLEKSPKFFARLSKSVKLPGSPVSIFVTSSAIRAIHLQKNLQNLTPGFKVAKLFAKHKKLKEQREFLTQNCIKIAVGTPKRFSELINTDALNLAKLRYIFIDWHFRDSKLRRIADIAETANELWELINRYLLHKITNDKVKVHLH